MQTQDFKTHTNYIERKNITAEGFWPIAMDIGYSGVKEFSPNSVSCFPSFARRREESVSTIGEPSSADILYRDNDQKIIWDVGDLAINSIQSNDVNDSINTLYTRFRYDNPMFLVLARVGMAMAMYPNLIRQKGKTEKIVLQTGLPSAYKDSDTGALRDALCGYHNFSLRLGAYGWREFSFYLGAEDIYVMQQPLGSYFGACLDNSANMTAQGKQYFKMDGALLDAGFGTVDLCKISARTHRISGNETFPELGMKEIFRRTVKEISNRYGAEIAVHALQPYLATGMIPVPDRKARKRINVPFEEILLRHSKNVCNEALDKMEVAYNGLIGCQYLLLTGGTCAVWYEQIRKRYALMEDLCIISGAQNDNLPYIYANTRGYYLFRVRALLDSK